MRLEEGKDYLRCDFCKNFYFPTENEDGVRILGEYSTLPCPVCAVPLVHAAVSGRRLFYCEHCRGMLVSMDLFEGLTEDLRARVTHKGPAAPAPDPEELKRRLNCPHCRKPMDAHYYGGPGNIVIDDCSACGFNWLDYGKLTRIIHAPGPV